MLAWLLSSTRRRVACCSGWTPCNHSYGCSLDSLAIRLGGPYGRALPAHAPARAGAGASHHRDDDVPRDGDDVLAGAGSGRSHEARELNWPEARAPVIDPPRPAALWSPASEPRPARGE